jgi:hypothetical protein
MLFYIILLFFYRSLRIDHVAHYLLSLYISKDLYNIIEKHNNSKDVATTLHHVCLSSSALFLY